MEQNEKDFLEDNIINYHTISQAGFVRNIELPVLNQYEALYRKYLNPTYAMCKYCKDDIFGALERLYEYYLSLPQEQVQSFVQKSVEPVQFIVQDSVQPKKRGRPKK
jgi:hypothetical protein